MNQRDRQDRQSRLRLSPGKTVMLLILSIFLTAMIAPTQHPLQAATSQQRPRNIWIIGCPPPTDAMYRKFGPVNFNPQNDPYDNKRQMKFDSVWIGISDGGKYQFIISGTSSRTPFLVDVWHRETKNGINQQNNWYQIVNGVWSQQSFGGGQKFEFDYNSRASDPNLHSVDVVVKMYPQDQQNASDYTIYYHATNCAKPQTTPPPPPSSKCFWDQNSVLGQPSGPCFCVCNGKVAADNNCPQPKPKC